MDGSITSNMLAQNRHTILKALSSSKPLTCLTRPEAADPPLRGPEAVTASLAHPRSCFSAQSKAVSPSGSLDARETTHDLHSIRNYDTLNLLLIRAFNDRPTCKDRCAAELILARSTRLHQRPNTLPQTCLSLELILAVTRRTIHYEVQSDLAL